MALIEAVYICDKCGMRASYLPMLFHKDYRGQARLCEPCTGLFREQYKLWCNDPKPEPPVKRRHLRLWFG